MSLRDLAGTQLAETAFGLLIGTGARYAIRIQDRLAIGWREIVADVLLLGLNGFITYTVVDRLGATGKGAILTAAMFGIAQDRVIRAFLRWSERRADQLDVMLGNETPQRLPVVLPSPAEPKSAADLTRGEVGDHLRGAYRKPIRTPPPEDQIELLRRLDKED